MRLFASAWPTHVISVLVGDVPRYGQKHLHVRFDDIVRPQPGLTLPAPEHLNRIYEFASTLEPDSRLLVHCHRGLNRSPAVAVGVLIQTGAEYTEAFRRVAEQCPHMEPNRLVMLYIGQHFGLSGKLSRLARNTIHPKLVAPRGAVTAHLAAGRQ
jgi:predicted protein tyrosine phosphatase